MGLGPKAMLYADHVDSVSVAGLIIDNVWNGNKVITTGGGGMVITDDEDYEKELGYREIVPGQIERRTWKSYRSARPGRVTRPRCGLGNCSPTVL